MALINGLMHIILQKGLGRQRVHRGAATEGFDGVAGPPYMNYPPERGSRDHRVLGSRDLYRGGRDPGTQTSRWR